MRAIEVMIHGDPDVLRVVELPDPKPTGGQVRVRLENSGVLWLDTAIRAGSAPPPFLPPLPYVPGLGGAGVVDEVAEGIDPAWVGRRVLVDATASYAEQMVAAVEDLIPIPDELDTDQAMALLHDGGTALACGRRQVRPRTPPSSCCPLPAVPARS